MFDVHVYVVLYVFFTDTATPEIYTYCHTLSLHDALPICGPQRVGQLPGRPRQREPAARQFPPWEQLAGVLLARRRDVRMADDIAARDRMRSEEHTSELQSLMRISYAVFCLKKKKQLTINNTPPENQPRTCKQQIQT